MSRVKGFWIKFIQANTYSVWHKSRHSKNKWYRRKCGSTSSILVQLSVSGVNYFILIGKEIGNSSEWTHTFVQIRRLKQDVHGVVNNNKTSLGLQFLPRLSHIPIWTAWLECLVLVTLQAEVMGIDRRMASTCFQYGGGFKWQSDLIGHPHNLGGEVKEI